MIPDLESCVVGEAILVRCAGTSEQVSWLLVLVSESIGEHAVVVTSMS